MPRLVIVRRKLIKDLLVKPRGPPENSLENGGKPVLELKKDETYYTLFN